MPDLSNLNMPTLGASSSYESDKNKIKSMKGFKKEWYNGEMNSKKCSAYIKRSNYADGLNKQLYKSRGTAKESEIYSKISSFGYNQFIMDLDDECTRIMMKRGYE
ncbi:hypothetical protein [Campylobacter geochelonis]|uniref:Uncharacterized protein n=1 Tax=Campylobacter geochelonis TaxID=1780362 RepID=A0A128EJL1_9BACT|nr:hypothetical protein [Campylobacter geochelonis]QKF70745.1 hypothetical protein CGEO_0415 [Campylobacter geochelonis]CZE48592.1 Uncharacterised protein [Campylobacter geochelonis]